MDSLYNNAILENAPRSLASICMDVNFMSKSLKATLKQVAELADVSLSAASLILNQKPDVSFSKETVSRVMLAAETLGYGRSHTPAAPPEVFRKKVIALFMPGVTGNYYTSMVYSIDQAASQQGYDTVCFETHRSKERELRGLSYFSKSDIAGIIFTFIPHNYELVEEIAKTIPVVVVGNRNQVLHLDMVETDNYRAGVLLARHMLELGHRHVAFLATTREWWGYASAQRLVGAQETFQKECPQAKLTVKTLPAGDPLMGEMLSSRKIGAMLCESCLEDRSITGFIAIHDYVAYGALDALAQHGYRVPEDYSVCGCDDIFASSIPGVGLTTVNHHIQEKGAQAFALLNRKMHDASTGEEQPSAISIMRVEILSTLMVRTSTAKPGGNGRR